ncbi:MAG: cation:proton antiporter [Beijerinckiaceae bacterium]
MAAVADPTIYKDALLFLGAAAVVIPAFQRFRISPVFGFLAVGVLVGPSVAGKLAAAIPALRPLVPEDREGISLIGDLGVVFLLFMIGLELSFERLKTMRRLVFGLGLAQVILSTAALTLLLKAGGVGWTPALVLGSALSLSSTAIVVEVLSQEKRLASTGGRLSFAVLLMQDLAVIPLVLFVTIAARPATDAIGLDVLLALAQAVLAVLAIVFAGRIVLRPLFRHVARAHSQDLFMAACLLVVMATGLAAAVSGLSMALGAFVAGLLLAETEYRKQIEITIEPFKGLLLGLFFFSVGMSVNLSIIAAAPLRILGFAALMISIKALIVYGLGRVFRVRGTAAMEAGLLLGPGGEFAFVLIGLAAGLGVINESIRSEALTITAISMALIPLLGTFGQNLEKQNARSQEDMIAAAPVVSEVPRALIVGFGRAGHLVAEMLRDHEIPFVAIDQSVRQVTQARKDGWPVYYGDATNADLLRTCNIGTIDLMIVTMDTRDGIEKVIDAARGQRPDLTVVARARDIAHARRLYERGVTEAVPENVEASLHIAEAALVGLGIPMGLVIADIHERRDQYRAIFQRIGGDGRATAQRNSLRERLKATPQK